MVEWSKHAERENRERLDVAREALALCIEGVDRVVSDARWVVPPDLANLRDARQFIEKAADDAARALCKIDGLIHIARDGADPVRLYGATYPSAHEAVAYVAGIVPLAMDSLIEVTGGPVENRNERLPEMMRHFAKSFKGVVELEANLSLEYAQALRIAGEWWPDDLPRPQDPSNPAQLGTREPVPLTTAERKAYQQFMAATNDGRDELTRKQVHEWAMEQPDVEWSSFSAFTQALTRANRKLGNCKNTSRAGRSGRSIVKADEL